MQRLDTGEPLSSVLSQVRLLANMTGDMLKVALMDMLIYGLDNIPDQSKPFTGAYKVAGTLYTKLFAIEDVSKLDINVIVRDPWSERIPEKEKVVILSVSDMENLSPPLTPRPGDSYDLANGIFQHRAYFDTVKSILVRLRAFIYDYVSNIWLESVREQERIKLLGSDYRLITDKLDTLETPVGGELIAAVDNLRSTNPANWNACALMCRNVVLKLAKMLWTVSGQTYVTVGGEELQVSGNKEKNRLLAYIDAYYRQVDHTKQSILNEAKDLVHPVYNIGSKGKQQVRHEEAQKLVIDTFRLVDLLDRATELKPIDRLP